METIRTLNASLPPASAGPVAAFLAELHARLSGLTEGRVADYIPELGKADPGWFGIALATVDGESYQVGDADRSFTIQSVSKPFAYGLALKDRGQAAVLERVGVEPTGEPFNAIVLDEVHNRPFNPMVNAGAIAVSGLIDGATPAERERRMLDFFGSLAGRPMALDMDVYRSELATGHKNRAIAYLMLNSGMIRGDPVEVLDLYFRQCSVAVTCRDLAMMAATLANDGVNPRTGEAVLAPAEVRDVLAVMSSCGMYDYAGQWGFEVGLPAKSGVSGAVIAVIPGQIGLGVYSPALDAYGNSVRGVEACREISRAFGLHLLSNRPSTRSVVRREYSGDAVRSRHLRSPDEVAWLESEGGAIAVVELQGALYFGTAERLLRRVAELAETARFVIVDFKRVYHADAAATKLLPLMRASGPAPGCTILPTHLDADGPLAGLRAAMLAADAGLAPHPDTDGALEWCEDLLLTERPGRTDRDRLSLASLELFDGLSREECRSIETILEALQFEPGETIIRAGDPANLLFVVARGTVTVTLPVAGDRPRRVASIGPGLAFGEMALLDGGVRSADVTADGRVLCYGLSVLRLRELAAENPNILLTILGNLARTLTQRLRQANREIRALD